MFAAVLATGPAMSQALVTRAVGLAHECFIYAKTGLSPRDGVETCNRSLRDEALSRHDRAATFDNRGVMQDQLGRTDLAEADFQDAIRLNPDRGDPYVNLGSMLIKKRQLAAALDSITKGLALGMSFPHIGYYDKALAEELSGKYLEAYHDYKKVLELDPHYAAAEERLKDFTVIKVPAKATPG
jgi:lipoprotein NlpI